MKKKLGIQFMALLLLATLGGCSGCTTASSGDKSSAPAETVESTPVSSEESSTASETIVEDAYSKYGGKAVWIYLKTMLYRSQAIIIIPLDMFKMRVYCSYSVYNNCWY